MVAVIVDSQVIQNQRQGRIIPFNGTNEAALKKQERTAFGGCAPPRPITRGLPAPARVAFRTVRKEDINAGDGGDAAGHQDHVAPGMLQYPRRTNTLIITHVSR